MAGVEKEISCWPSPGNEERDVSCEMCLVQAKTRKWIMTKKTPAEARSGGPGGNHCVPAFTMELSAVPRPSLKGGELTTVQRH